MYSKVIALKGVSEAQRKTNRSKQWDMYRKVIALLRESLQSKKTNWSKQEDESAPSWETEPSNFQHIFDIDNSFPQ